MNTTDNKTTKKLHELIGALSVEFIVGVALTTVIGYDPEKTTVLQNIVLGLHAFIGTYLLVISVLFAIRSAKSKILVNESRLGLLGLFIAFGGGSMAARSENDWATLVMALGFLMAFLAYAMALTKSNNTQS